MCTCWALLLVDLLVLLLDDGEQLLLLIQQPLLLLLLLLNDLQENCVVQLPLCRKGDTLSFRLSSLTHARYMLLRNQEEREVRTCNQLFNYCRSSAKQGEGGKEAEKREGTECFKGTNLHRAGR